MTKNKPFNFVFIGRSGSGKGTQAELLKKGFDNSVIITTGNLFRDLSKKNTDAGKRVKKILDEGGLPFDELATALWMREIAYFINENQGIICDGFPRRLHEAENLGNFLNWLERKENTFYFLVDISREEAFKRLKLRNREDDTDEQVNNRLDYYENRVVPVVNYYEKQGILTKINGEQSIEDIHQDIMDKIKDNIKNDSD